MADLRAWLQDRGFVVLSDHYDPEHFGDQVVQLARPLGIRLVRDRGEWSVDVVGADGEWIDIHRWRGATRSQRSEPPSAAEQAQRLREVLDEIEAPSAPPDVG
jgi:hypothetical protein